MKGAATVAPFKDHCIDPDQWRRRSSEALGGWIDGGRPSMA